MTVPTILRLKIERFRGLKAIDWSPSTGLNLILGGGDVSVPRCRAARKTRWRRCEAWSDMVKGSGVRGQESGVRGQRLRP